MDRLWVTATFKEPVNGAVWLGKEGFAGDQQADRRYHGGADKAALTYSFDHYASWEPEGFPVPMPPGSFGENILVSGMVERDVFIGDIYKLGKTTVQVSQPRYPCSKQERRWRMPGLVKRILESGRTGWYLRVLEEGLVEAGDSFDLQERPFPQWNVPRAHSVMQAGKEDPEAMAELARCPALSQEWRSALLKRLTA
jgi:MOSC domain-containing protein YiiM